MTIVESDELIRASRQLHYLMPLQESLRAAIQRLIAAHVGSPRMNAEVLLMFTLGCDRAYLYAHPERELTADETSRYDDALSQRAQGVPSQYITGHQEFWGMDLVVTPAVLIPRPETEHLIETLLPLARSMFPQADGRSGRPYVSHPRIVDVGTGSGCIALALAKELPGAEIHATDISSHALEIAQANAARHGLQSRIAFHQTDLLDSLPPGFEFIISNPPYVGDSEEDQVQLEVRKFEPRNAVFAGATGTEVIARLVTQARAKLAPGGWLIMEISGTIVDEVCRLLGDWNGLEIKNDLQGIPRVALARVPLQ